MIKLKSLLEVEGTEPGIYYHVTFQKKLGKIKKDGLVAQKKGEWYGSAGQDIRQVKGVFVFENYYDAMTWCFKTNWDRPTEKLVILKLKTNDTDFVEDTHWQASGIGKWLVKQSSFKPSDIVKVIPFDIDKWTPELTMKIKNIKHGNISEDLSNTVKLKDLLLENLNEGKITDKIQPTDRIIMAKKDIFPLRFPVKQDNRGTQGIAKPNGLWYAIGTEWIDWVKSEMPHWKGDYLYKVYLNESKILTIKDEKGLEEFHNKYSFVPTYHQGKIIRKYNDIDWLKVSLDYSGIEIAPYQYTYRHKFLWYYTWDVASGCIWNKDAIKKITRIEG